MDRQTVMRQKSTRLFVCAFVVMAAPVHRACFLVFLLCQEDKEMYDSCILLRIPLTTHFLSSIPLINSWGKHSRHNWVIFQTCKIMLNPSVDSTLSNYSELKSCGFKSNHTIRNLHFLFKNSTLISRKNCRFFGVKTRENVVVLDFLAVDNFDFTRKIVK